MTKVNTIIKDITGEYIAIVVEEEIAYAKNITEWINETSVEDLDTTNAGWDEISIDEAEKIISNGTIIDEA